MTKSNHEDLMPGENNPEFARIVREYLGNFSYYKVRKEWALKEELYLWCRNNLGEQYKDWFVHEGGTRDKWWTVNVRSPKHGTLFALRWNDIIIESVDRRKS
jgi:hypothetical protein